MKRNNKKIYIFLCIILGLFLISLILLNVSNVFDTSMNELSVNESVIDNKEDYKLNNIDLNEKRLEFNNDNIIGRLEIPGLFNLLITQADDNDYYTNHNIRKNNDIKGNEFIDYRNNVLDKNINIYGHNSRTYDLPFRKLEKFLDEEHFMNNEYIIFQHDNGNRVYEIVAFKKVIGEYEHMKIDAVNQKEHIEKLIDGAMYSKSIKYDNNTNVIVLQTCVMNEPKSFYIVVGFEMID